MLSDLTVSACPVLLCPWASKGSSASTSCVEGLGGSQQACALWPLRDTSCWAGVLCGNLLITLKLQYFGHLMRRVDALEKTLMLGGIGGRYVCVRVCVCVCVCVCVGVCGAVQYPGLRGH